MPIYTYPAHVFHQYAATKDKAHARLVHFTAPAAEIRAWAGIPRKGWHLRALYQRILNPNRESQISKFFSKSSGRSFGNLSPTAITIALGDDVVVPKKDGSFELSLTIEDPPPAEDIPSELQALAERIYPVHLERLDARLRKAISAFANGNTSEDDITQEIESDDYVGQFVLDLVQLASDPLEYLERRQILDDSARQKLLDSLYDLSKPALIVDGQHRVVGASQAHGPKVSFLICAMPDCSWAEQTFQFVVINEEAKSVPASVLYDIFGSSLTRAEATEIKSRLGRAGRSVDERIAAVVSMRDPESPFYGMVKVDLEGKPDSGRPFMSPRLLVELIEGSAKTKGFRTDDDFVKFVVAPSLPPGEQEGWWSDWEEGRWQEYWFALWRAVRDYFNEGDTKLWDPDKLQNLTKGVALKALQTLLIKEMTESAKGIQQQVADLVDVGVDEGQIQKIIGKRVLPPTPEAFYERVRESYLNGFPRAFFEKPWEKSLDTQAGFDALYSVMQTTWSSYSSGKGNTRYPYWKNAQVFAVAERSSRSRSKD